MNDKEIEVTDIVYRAYYNAYRENQMIGVIDVANGNGLTVDQVNKAILFLEAEDKIKFSNKGFDPINSGVVYSLTKQGYSWFAKTCYVDELIKKPSIPIDTNPTNYVHVQNSTGVQIGNTTHLFNSDNSSQINNTPINRSESPKKTEEPMIKKILIAVISGIILFFILAFIKGWLPFLK